MNDELHVALRAACFRDEGKRVFVPEIDPLVLDSVFPAPGRNEPCHCYSGKKYKRCCEFRDREAWREVAKMTRQAGFACMLLRGLQSNFPKYEVTPV